MRSGQAAFEFMLLIAAVTFMFVIFVLGVNYNITGKSIERRNIVLEDTASIVRDEIKLAFESSDGYLREFKLPEKILHLDYEMVIDGSLLSVKIIEEGDSLSLSVDGVQGQPIKGINVIKKIGGVVYLNQ